MDLDLAGKRALVTGASRGIGLAVAETLAAEGAHVALAARDRGALESAAAGIKGRAFVAVTDTSDDASVLATVAAVTAEFGGIDILVNAAAQPATPGPRPALADVTDESLRAEIETKVLGYLRCARAVAPFMVAQRWGRIINISGLAARQANSIVGSIRNVAVAAMAKNLADELGRDGVNVTVVHPGVTVTDRIPTLVAALAEREGIDLDAARARLDATATIGRMVTAAEVADVVAFLASPRGVAITGDAIAVGGGVTGPIYY